MVEITIEGSVLRLDVQGMDKLWALKSSIEIPIANVRDARAEPGINISDGGFAIRMPGTSLPGVITAGTYLQAGNRVFWDVHNSEKAIVIDLNDERYKELVVEVADPATTVDAIKAAIASRPANA